MKSLLLSFLLLVVYQSAKAQTETSVLFIGNSYTIMNDMPVLFKDLAASFNRKVEIDTVINRGKNLKFQSLQPQTYEKIKSRKWDYVVIQGHSSEFAQPQSVVDQNSKPYLSQLIDSVRANNSCTKVVMYMTWGYKNGNTHWAPINTYATMQATIEKEYLRCADLFSVSVVPVGMAWQEVRNAAPEIELYDADLMHPSLKGSYLAACTFYTSIFGVSPTNNTFKLAIPETEKAKLELSASQMVLNNLNRWRWVPRKPETVTGFDLVLANNSLILQNKASNYDSLSWDFGDGTKSVEANPKHDYSKKGEYFVVQKVSNSCGVKYVTRKIEVVSGVVQK